MSALSSQLNAPLSNITEQQDNQQPLYLLPPDDIDTLWNHQDPREFFSQKLRKHIEEYDQTLKKSQGISINEYDEFNNYYEKPELNWLADYYINNLIFCKRDLNMSDSGKICELLQLLWDLLDWKNKEARGVKDQYNLKYALLTTNLQRLYSEKVLSRDEVKGVLEYARRTYFRHFHLYNYCIQNKQKQVEKPVTIFAPKPASALGNLSIDACKEIIDAKPEDEQKDDVQDGEGEGEKKEGEEEEEEHVDPNDPLYGLEQRLKNLEIDDESKRIIKEKLEEASSKIKTQLEDRQKNLDTKLAEKGGPAKKK